MINIRGVGLTLRVGLVITMQLRPNMVRYGAESQLPALVGIAMIREIGPVITALIFAGIAIAFYVGFILVGVLRA